MSIQHIILCHCFSTSDDLDEYFTSSHYHGATNDVDSDTETQLTNYFRSRKSPSRSEVRCKMLLDL